MGFQQAEAMNDPRTTEQKAGAHQRWLLIGLLLLLVFPLERFATRARAAREADRGPFSCQQVTEIPLAECEALLGLYQNTGGETWITQTGWHSTLTPCTWHGVACNGGRVTELLLPSNHLSGTLPSTLSSLSGLQVLHLSGNTLAGPWPANLANGGALHTIHLDNNRWEGTVPPALCTLPLLTLLDVGYNAFTTAEPCLATRDPDWATTQTVAPREVRAAALSPTSVRVSWTPIPYQSDGGHYEVLAATPGTAYTSVGTTATKSNSFLDVTGLTPATGYSFVVRTLTSAHPGQPNALQSALSPPASTTTPAGAAVQVLAILAFDNDLSPYSAEVLERFQRGTALNPDVRVTLLVDEAGRDNSQVVEIGDGRITPTHSLPWLGPAIQEVDTADPEVLAGFLTWARPNATNTPTIVTLLGHGVGPIPTVAWVPVEGLMPPVPSLPQERDRTPFDITSGTYLSTPELGEALDLATAHGAAPFDLLFFDQCFEGNLDVLYQVRHAADVFVASPNYAWAAFAYERYLPHFGPNATTAQMAQAILTEYEAALDDSHPNAMIWLTRETIDGVASATSTLGAALQSERITYQGAILESALASRFVDTTLHAGDLELRPPDELMGLGSFVRALRARVPPGTALYQATGTVLARLAEVQGVSRVGQPWPNPTTTWAYTDTLSVLAPLTPTLTTETIWRASIYTETVPLDAVWGPVPSRRVTITEPLSYTQDGRWDDFIAAWYAPLTPTVGALARSFPPPVVLNDPAAITLTVQATADHIFLDWTTPLPPAIASYALYVRWPDSSLWELLTVQPTTAQGFAHLCPPPGEYHYFVTARDGAGRIVARSQEIPVVKATFCSQYLPVISRP